MLSSTSILKKIAKIVEEKSLYFSEFDITEILMPTKNKKSIVKMGRKKQQKESKAQKTAKKSLPSPPQQQKKSKRKNSDCTAGENSVKKLKVSLAKLSSELLDEYNSSILFSPSKSLQDEDIPGTSSSNLHSVGHINDKTCSNSGNRVRVNNSFSGFPETADNSSDPDRFDASTPHDSEGPSRCIGHDGHFELLGNQTFVYSEGHSSDDSDEEGFNYKVEHCLTDVVSTKPENGFSARVGRQRSVSETDDEEYAVDIESFDEFCRDNNIQECENLQEDENQREGAHLQGEGYDVQEKESEKSPLSDVFNEENTDIKFYIGDTPVTNVSSPSKVERALEQAPTVPKQEVDVEEESVADSFLQQLSQRFKVLEESYFKLSTNVEISVNGQAEALTRMSDLNKKVTKLLEQNKIILEFVRNFGREHQEISYNQEISRDRRRNTRNKTVANIEELSPSENTSIQHAPLNSTVPNHENSEVKCQVSKHHSRTAPTAGLDNASLEDGSFLISDELESSTQPSKSKEKSSQVCSVGSTKTATDLLNICKPNKSKEHRASSGSFIAELTVQERNILNTATRGSASYHNKSVSTATSNPNTNLSTFSPTKSERTSSPDSASNTDQDNMTKLAVNKSCSCQKKESRTVIPNELYKQAPLRTVSPPLSRSESVESQMEHNQNPSSSISTLELIKQSLLNIGQAISPLNKPPAKAVGCQTSDLSTRSSRSDAALESDAEPLQSTLRQLMNLTAELTAKQKSVSCHTTHPQNNFTSVHAPCIPEQRLSSHSVSPAVDVIQQATSGCTVDSINSVSVHTPCSSQIPLLNMTVPSSVLSSTCQTYGSASQNIQKPTTVTVLKIINPPTANTTANKSVPQTIYLQFPNQGSTTKVQPILPRIAYSPSPVNNLEVEDSAQILSTQQTLDSTNADVAHQNGSALDSSMELATKTSISKCSTPTLRSSSRTLRSSAPARHSSALPQRRSGPLHPSSAPSEYRLTTAKKCPLPVLDKQKSSEVGKNNEYKSSVEAVSCEAPLPNSNLEKSILSKKLHEEKKIIQPHNANGEMDFSFTNTIEDDNTEMDSNDADDPFTGTIYDDETASKIIHENAGTIFDDILTTAKNDSEKTSAVTRGVSIDGILHEKSKQPENRKLIPSNENESNSNEVNEVTHPRPKPKQDALPNKKQDTLPEKPPSLINLISEASTQFQNERQLFRKALREERRAMMEAFLTKGINVNKKKENDSNKYKQSV